MLFVLVETFGSGQDLQTEGIFDPEDSEGAELNI